MSVQTKNVSGRRQLHFDSWQEILDDAEQMVATDSKTIGNWSHGQIIQHVARSMHKAMDGTAAAPPWYMKLMAKFMKKPFLTKPMSPGFKLPPRMLSDFGPDDDVTPEDAVQELREAVQAMQSLPPTINHFIFGKISEQEYLLAHCRHAEMHFSFIVPA